MISQASSRKEIISYRNKALQSSVITETEIIDALSDDEPANENCELNQSVFPLSKLIMKLINN